MSVARWHMEKPRAYFVQDGDAYHGPYWTVGGAKGFRTSQGKKGQGWKVVELTLDGSREVV